MRRHRALWRETEVQGGTCRGKCRGVSTRSLNSEAAGACRANGRGSIPNSNRLDTIKDLTITNQDFFLSPQIASEWANNCGLPGATPSVGPEIPSHQNSHLHHRRCKCQRNTLGIVGKRSSTCRSLHEITRSHGNMDHEITR